MQRGTYFVGSFLGDTIVNGLSSGRRKLMKSGDVTEDERLGLSGQSKTQ